MGKRLTENPNIRKLGSWITLPEAADMLGVSRQHVYNKAVAGHFNTLHRVGAATFVVDSREIEEHLTKVERTAKLGLTTREEES